MIRKVRMELKKEGVAEIVPRRLKKMGPCPGKTTSELFAKRQDTSRQGLDEKVPDTKWKQSRP